MLRFTFCDGSILTVARPTRFDNVDWERVYFYCSLAVRVEENVQG